MSTRFAWLLGLAVLVGLGLLVACGSNYSSSSDGLMLVGSQGSALIETFSFNLNSGHPFGISNPPSSTADATCILPGLPSSIVMDPAGAYAYTIVNANPGCPGSTNGILSIKVNSDGSIPSSGASTSDPTPVALAMDSKGKFLFVVEGTNSVPPSPSDPNPMPCPGTTSQYGICSYAIGSGGTLTPVPGTFNLILQPGFLTPNFVAVATSPTVFPALGVNGVQNAVCSAAGTNPPSVEFLYVADQQNNVVWAFGVDTSTGAITNLPTFTQAQYIAAGSQPSGVAVDPCQRFVYVANNLSNNVSAYAICNGSSTQPTQIDKPCPATPTSGDGTLRAVVASPFSLPGSATFPGPIAVDPFGKYVYVVGTGSNTVSPFRIASVTGALTALTNTATGSRPVSIAIRGDDNWLFVANYNAATVSQYQVTPETGALNPAPVIDVDNLPWGVAVK
jgi:6-phosphogluconolactonase (cycloisomerase 2 family)